MPQRALNREELRDAIFSTPYEKMPYTAYWDRLEAPIGRLAAEQGGARGASCRNPFRALDHLELLSNGLHVCSATNFLHQAQGNVGGVARLAAENA